VVVFVYEFMIKQNDTSLINSFVIGTGRQDALNIYINEVDNSSSIFQRVHLTGNFQ